MIISHKHKYLFIEIAHTGTTAISQELRENYDGSSILHKHANYLEFLKVATPEEKKYFVFAGIRNPLDEAVSLYFKYKTNHKGKYTNPNRLAKEGGNITQANIARYNFINNTDADYAAYFKKFYKLPYNNVDSSLSHQYCNFIIRFENLQDDFAQALRLIGLEPVRPLPYVNRTGEKKGHFLSYYSPEIREQAKANFGPFMKKWGYDFPAEWGDVSISWWKQAEFQAVVLIRNIYWRYIRRSPRFYGRLMRRLIS